MSHGQLSGGQTSRGQMAAVKCRVPAATDRTNALSIARLVLSITYISHSLHFVFVIFARTIISLCNFHYFPTKRCDIETLLRIVVNVHVPK